jgi:hypothetical protein
MKSIQEEIKQTWEEIIDQTGWDSLFEPDFGSVVDASGAKVEERTRVELEPWLSILEQEIKWLSCLFFVLDDYCDELDSDFRVPWSLAGAACTQATAIRKLCLCGLDLPAKAVLRTLIETLNIFVLTIKDRELLRSYRAADLDSAREFWHKELGSRKLRAKLTELYTGLDLEPGLLAQILDWQRREVALASQAIHPSYTLSVFASMPPTFDSDMCKPGILGAATPLSLRTLSEASKTIWLHGRLGFRLLIDPLDDTGVGLLKLEGNKKQADRIVAYGYLVIDKLVQRHWDDVCYEGFGAV